MPGESRGVLDGVTVLEFCSYIAAPVAAVMLAEMGADVIKIERLATGDPFRGARTVLGVDQTLPGDRTVSYDLCNRSKRCIALNLEDPRGQELAHRLVKKADVVLTNMSRGGAKRLGIDPETLNAVNPDLIYARLTAWGSRGPDADRKGMDYMMQGPSGLMWNTGDRDSNEPSRVASTILDGASAVTLVTAVLAALLNRELHGGGQEVSTSLLGTSLTLQRASVGNTLWLGQGYPRTSRTAGRNPIGTFYRCSDDKWITFQNPLPDQVWPEFASIVGLPEDVDWLARPVPEVVALLDELFATLTRDQWCAAFSQTQIGWAPVYTLEEAAKQPQAIENAYVIEEDHPTLGPILAPGFPIDFAKTPCSVQRPAPEFGEHTEEILLENAGLTWDDITELKQSGVIN